MEFINKTNYEKLLDTANIFCNSQGFYGRLKETLEQMTDEEINQVNDIEELKTTKDTLDVVLFLEQ